MVIIWIFIGFFSITLLIKFFERFKKAEEWLEENANKILFFIIAISILFFGFRTNEFIANQMEKIKEIPSNTILYLIKNIVSSGLLLVFILLLIGWTTRWIYKILSKKLNIEKYELSENSIKKIFVFATLTCILFYIATDGFKSMTYFSVFAILLGKVIWIDTTKKDLEEMIEKLFKIDIKSTIIQLIMLTIMGIFLITPIHLDFEICIGVFVGIILAMFMLIKKIVKDVNNK